MIRVKIQTLQPNVDLQEYEQLYFEVWEDRNRAFKETFKRHTTYEGFDGYNVRTESQQLVGFIYGYSSLPGQFYHDRLSQAVTSEDYDKWLKDSFEIVELVVSPDYQRQGIGQLLLSSLLKDKKKDTAILTTGIENTSAQSLYQKFGFESIIPSFHPTDPNEPYVLMGKKLDII